MSPMYVLWVLLLNTQTGEILEGHPAGDAETLEECIAHQAGHVSQAKDGKVEILVCERQIIPDNQK